MDLVVARRPRLAALDEDRAVVFGGGLEAHALGRHVQLESVVADGADEHGDTDLKLEAEQLVGEEGDGRAVGIGELRLAERPERFRVERDPGEHRLGPDDERGVFSGGLAGEANKLGEVRAALGDRPGDLVVLRDVRLHHGDAPGADDRVDRAEMNEPRQRRRDDHEQREGERRDESASPDPPRFPRERRGPEERDKQPETIDADELHRGRQGRRDERLGRQVPRVAVKEDRALEHLHRGPRERRRQEPRDALRRSTGEPDEHGRVEPEDQHHEGVARGGDVDQEKVQHRPRRGRAEAEAQTDAKRRALEPCRQQSRRREQEREGRQEHRREREDQQHRMDAAEHRREKHRALHERRASHEGSLSPASKTADRGDHLPA